MNNYRYQLQKYAGMGSKHTCPSCNKKKHFVLYIDTYTNEVVNDNVGRCDGQIKCGYNYTPMEYFKENGRQIMNQFYPPNMTTSHISLIDNEILKKSLSEYQKNSFVKFLGTVFNNQIVDELTKKYFVGTSHKYYGANVFWQVDIKGNIRTGKIMLYNEVTGKRVKELSPPITWAHKALKLANFNLKQCLYGEHLLKGNNKPVAIVESEKTAIICSVKLPEFIWLACGGLENLSSSKCAILKGRDVTLFPDLNGYEKWSEKAKNMRFKISATLEKHANEEEKKMGLDLADFLIKI